MGLSTVMTPVSVFDLRTIATGLAIAALVYLVTLLWLRPRYFSPLKNVPGPGRGSLIMGHIPEILKGGPGEYHRVWAEQYGGLLRYFAFFGSERLEVTDPKALHYMLVQNPYDFPKTELTRGEISKILGEGVLFAEGDDHRRQRRIMNPAFINSHIARLVPAFFAKSARLVEILQGQVGADEGKAPVVNVERYLSRCTLDIIGQVGFGYEFGAQDNSENPLAKSFSKMMRSMGGRDGPMFIIFFVLSRVFPFMLNLPTERLKTVKANMDTMVRESSLIVENKKLSDPDHADRDLLALLLKANESETSKTAMSDEELRGQLTTMILAGHETTATASSFALMELARRPDVQEKLREEAIKHKLGPSTIQAGLSFEELNSMPYLDAFTREVLRLHPPVPGTIRESRVANWLPLSKPLPDGATSVYIPAGQTFFLSILAINQSKAMWGEDALEFRPERWTEIPERVKQTTQYALWSNQLTFLAGARGCIGYRLALSEFKAIIATLIVSFDFSSGLQDGQELIKKSAIVTKTFLKGSEKEGPYMPIRIKSL